MSALPPHIGAIAEPLLLAHLLNWGLFGALSVQVYIYYLAFPDDPIQRKVLVYAVYAAELVQAILLSKMAYTEFAAGFGTFQALNNIGLLWFAVPTLSSIVAAVVQTFYASRIKLLANSYTIPMVIVLFSLVQVAGGFTLGVISKQNPLFSKLLDKKSLIAAGIWNGGSAMCDVIIAGSMTYYLSRRSLKTSWKSTQRTVQKLMRLVIETGILTATIAIVNLTLCLLPGRPAYFQTSSTVLGKMYSNTMLVVLNSRMTYSRTDTPSNELSDSIVFNARRHISVANGNISVTREQWTDPLDEYKTVGGKNSSSTVVPAETAEV